MNTVLFKGSGTTVSDIDAIARNNATIEIAPDIYERLAKARAILDQSAASGQQIYGFNTGLGANLKTPVAENAVASFQQQLVRGRGVGVGPALSREVTRAVMAARLAMLCVGGS